MAISISDTEDLKLFVHRVLSRANNARRLLSRHSAYETSSYLVSVREIIQEIIDDGTKMLKEDENG